MTGEVELRLNKVESEQEALKPRLEKMEEGFMRLEAATNKQTDAIMKLTESTIMLTANMEMMNRIEKIATEAHEKATTVDHRTKTFPKMREDIEDLQLKTGLLGQINKGMMILAGFFGPAAAVLLLTAIFSD